MVLLNTIEVDPPFVNASCAWSSDLHQLTDLYESPYTGAITTRTATLHGFEEDDSHAVAFLANSSTTINSYGYSPYPLSHYLAWASEIFNSHQSSVKPIILSITASDSQTLTTMVDNIQSLRDKFLDGRSNKSKIAIELNTSCPNIPGSPPSGYTFKSLFPLLQVLAAAQSKDPSLTLGIKLPPYTYKDQFEEVVSVLRSLSIAPGRDDCRPPFAFLTCTNTLGNSLFFAEQTLGTTMSEFAIPTAVGGLAGEALHPLALGNVYTFKRLLATPEAHYSRLGYIKIIGVGGVTSKAAAARMKKAGADIIGCATFFGKEGVRAFEILGED